MIYIIHCSLRKNYKERPDYAQLLEHPFIVKSSAASGDMGAYVTNVLERNETAETSS